jgi:hypothetical protein
VSAVEYPVTLVRTNTASGHEWRLKVGDEFVQTNPSGVGLFSSRDQPLDPGEALLRLLSRGLRNTR